MSLHYLVKCQKVMVSVGVSRMGKTGIVFVQPEPRLTTNITVNMFSVAVYYMTSVQDASATPGPCRRTAHRHTLLGTH